MKRRIIVCLLAACMILLLAVPAMGAEPSGDIVVLFTNDVHCGIDDNIGYAGLAAYRDELEAAGHTVILADAGDAIQGAPIGTLSEGSYLIDVMNEVGYDVLVPGNHEFDYGMDNFLKLAERAKSGYTSCNFVDSTGEPVFSPYRLIHCGDRTIAFIGITTPETLSSSTPTYFQDGQGNYIYGFCEGGNGQQLYDAVQAAADAAAKEADYVVAVGHLGMEGSVDHWRSDTVIANTSGIDAFLDAHSHETIPSMTAKNKNGESVLLASTGTKLEHIGQLTIHADGSMETTLVSDYSGRNAEIGNYIDNLTSRFDDVLQEVVATSTVDLIATGPDGSRLVRTQETNLGDFCADAYRAATGADIAFVNGGGIRANISKGSVTMEDIINVHPFSNEICMVETTGQDILDALEFAACFSPDENGSFQQVSGLTYEIHTYIPSGAKEDDKGNFAGIDGEYRVKNVKVGGEPLQTDRTYTLASHNYLLKESGGGFVMFRDDPLLLDCIALDNQVLIDYVEKQLGGKISSEYAHAQKRITIFTTPYADVNADSWYGSYVQYVHDAGLMNGISANLFAPEHTLNRAMMVTTLYRLSGCPKVTSQVSDVFTDCLDNTWYSDAVLWANQNDIITGYGNGLFAPTASLTKEAMAKILYTYSLYTGAPELLSSSLEYTDADAIAEWALPGVCYCTEQGILSGSAGRFSPKADATRAMAAKVLAILDQT